MGKTALVTELEVPTRSRNDIFIGGKFDQYNRTLPNSAFRQAFGELCHGPLRADPLERQRFKSDILQAVGDTLLIEVAHRRKECVRETDTVARIGGDEFVVVIRGLSGERSAAADQATIVAEKIRSALANRYRFTVGREDRTEDREHRCSASIGVLVFAIPSNTDADEMLRQADEAMYRAKADGGNQVHLVAAVAG